MIIYVICPCYNMTYKVNARQKKQYMTHYAFIGVKIGKIHANKQYNTIYPYYLPFIIIIENTLLV